MTESILRDYLGSLKFLGELGIISSLEAYGLKLDYLLCHHSSIDHRRPPHFLDENGVKILPQLKVYIWGESAYFVDLIIFLIILIENSQITFSHDLTCLKKIALIKLSKNSQRILKSLRKYTKRL